MKLPASLLALQSPAVRAQLAALPAADDYTLLRPAVGRTLVGCWARFPIRLESEANRRDHWGPKMERTREQRTIAAAVLSHIPDGWRPALPCVVLVTRIAPRALDDDNLVRSCKACRDQVAKWLGIDDRDRRVVWHYRQERAGIGEFGVRVELKAGEP